MVFRRRMLSHGLGVILFAMVLVGVVALASGGRGTSQRVVGATTRTRTARLTLGSGSEITKRKARYSSRSRGFVSRPVQRLSLGRLVVRRLASTDAYRSAVLADGPAAYWELDEASGSSASDSSGNSRTASYAGTYTHSSSVAPIGSDDAASVGLTGVSGSSVNGSIPASALNTGGGTFNTVELWMYWDGGGSGEGIFDFGSTSWSYALWINSTKIGFLTGHGEIWGTSNTGLANGWHLIDAEFENGSLNLSKLYVDGVAQTLTLSGGNQSVSVAAVGGNVATKVSGWAAGGSGNTFSGKLDEVSIFKGALTSSQITTHWNAVNGPPSNTTPPTVSGDDADGATLSTTNGSWSGSPTGYAYQWRRCDANGSSCADISGATATTYRLQDADVGSTIVASVTASNAAGSGAAAPASATVPIFPLSSPHAATMNQAVSSAGAWGYWKFDETSGTSAADSSGNAHPLTIGIGGWTSSPLWGKASAASDGKALKMRGNPNVSTPGDRAYLTAGTVSTFMNNFSVEAWVRVTGTSPWVAQQIFGVGNPFRSSPNGWGVWIDSDQRLALWMNGAQAAQGPKVPKNTWIHVGLVRDDGTWKLFLGSGLVAVDSTHTATGPSTLDFWFGGDAYNGGSWDLVGTIANAAFYDHALSNATMGGHGNALLAPSISPTQSLGPVGRGGLGPNPGGAQAEPVDTATGNFYTDVTDLSAASAGVAFAFTRTYNSGDPTSGRLGQGWVDSLDWTATGQSDGGVVIRSGTGQQLHFTLLADGTFAADPGGRATLTSLTGGGHELVTNDQTHYVFDSSGRLLSEKDRNGQGLTLTYSGTDLVSVQDSSGRTIAITTVSGKITHVQLPNGGGFVSFGYTSGLLTTVTDALGGVTTYGYDSAGRLTTIQDPTLATVLTNTYDSTTGRVTDQMDGRGKHTTFVWDATAQIATVTDPNGKIWKDVYNNGVLVKQLDGTNDSSFYVRDGNLGLTAVASPSGDTTTMTYDANGNVLSATAPASLSSVQKTFTYDSQNNVKSVTDGRGNVTTYTYDSNGNLTNVALNSTTIASYTYDTAGQKLTSTDGNNHTTTYTYDSSGNIASVTDALGDETTYTYDADGRVLSKVDPLGNVTGANPGDYTTSYTYPTAGHLVSTESDELGHTTSTTYDSAGHLLTRTDPLGHTTTRTYDGDGNLLTVTGPDPDGAGPLAAPVTSYTYDDSGNKLTETDPNNHTTTYTYDSSNRMVSKTTAEGNKTTYSHDANGNLATLTDPRGNVSGANPADYTTTYTYDAAGRRLTSADPLGHVTTYTYDAVGSRSSVRDANNHTTSYTYDAMGRVLTVTAPDGGVTTYSYDGNGNVLSRTDANNHTTNYVYDSANHLVQTTGPDPDGAGPLSAPVTTDSYDANGNITSSTDPNGNATLTVGDGTTSRSYDPANRLTGITYSDSTPSVSYTYDPAGNRTGMTDGSGSVTYNYDNLNELTSVARGTDTFSYAYDPAGNVTTRTFPGSLATSYTSNGENRITSATTSGNATSYAYDAAGNLTQTTLPSANGYVETRTYDKAGRLIDIKSAAGSSVLSEFAATLDAVGDPTEVDRTGATTSTTTYGYDANDRLTSVCYQTSCPNSPDPYIRWTYDKVGNRLTETRPAGTTNYSYNALDELTSAGSTPYTYDANGNELTAGGNAYAYDMANRMISASDGTTTTSYTYDGDGNRVQASSGPGSTTNYLWDTHSDYGVSELAIERDGSGSTLRSYAYGVNRTSMTSGSSLYYYHYDLVGSVVNLTSATGASEWTYAYDPFGATRTSTKNDPSAPANPMQFVGEYNDGNGLYNLRARQYDPSSGRLLGVDPAIQSGGQPSASSYAYVNDRPTVAVDPSGETARPVSTGVTMAGEAAGPAGCGGDSQCQEVGGEGAAADSAAQKYNNYLGRLSDSDIARAEEPAVAARIARARLPQQNIRYIPPRGYRPGNPLPGNARDGFIDEYGNRWQRGVAHGKAFHEGDPFEWDVQLSRSWQRELGDTRLNITIRGDISH